MSEKEPAVWRVLEAKALQSRYVMLFVKSLADYAYLAL
jgi:hypothetical protein